MFALCGFMQTGFIKISKTRVEKGRKVLVCTPLKNRKQTSNKLSAALSEDKGKHVHPSMVKRRLSKNGLKECKASKKS